MVFLMEVSMMFAESGGSRSTFLLNLGQNALPIRVAVELPCKNKNSWLILSLVRSMLVTRLQEKFVACVTAHIQTNALDSMWTYIKLNIMINA